jgi:WD40 repeat protein
MATGATNGVVRIWKTEDGQSAIDPIDHDERIDATFFSEDSSRLFCISGRSRVCVHDTRTGNRVGASFCISDEDFRSFRTVNSSVSTASPDGLKFVTTEEDVARIWDAGTGELLYQTAKHPSRIREAMFGPDSATVQTVTDDRLVQVWGIRAAEGTVDRWEDACDGDEKD